MEALRLVVKKRKRRFFYVLKELKRIGTRSKRIGGCVHDGK